MPAFYDLMKRRCQVVYYAFDIIWLNGRDLRELSPLERKKILRTVIPRKSSWIDCVTYVDRGALWYEILNPAYTQKTGRQEFFQRQ